MACCTRIFTHDAGRQVLLDGQALVGRRVAVLWQDHSVYFLGHITEFTDQASVLGIM